MNIYVLVKRTFDTEEKIVVSGGENSRRWCRVHH